MLIAIPSEAPGGLDAPVSDHFGHAAAFTLVKLDGGAIGEVRVVPNAEHDAGGCSGPVRVLHDLGVEVVVAGGVGQKPLAALRHHGVAVHSREDARTVAEAVQLYADGKSTPLGETGTCAGGGHCGGHAEAPRPPLDGPPVVLEGRLVSLSYELRDARGALLDSSDESGEMRLVQGGGLFPGLEAAIVGRMPGDRVTASLTPAEAFGERDEQQVFEHPRSALPDDVVVGDTVMARRGDGHAMPLTIREIREASVVLDANHPLAGMHVSFDVVVARVEAATPDEIAHGHVH